MIIDSYAMNLSSRREYVKVEGSTAAFSDKMVKAPEEASAANNDAAAAKLNISDAAKKLSDDSKASMEEFIKRLRSNGISSTKKVASNPKDLKMRMLEEMLYMLTGKRFRSFELPAPDGGRNFPAARQMQYLNTESFSYESETVSFQTQGVVSTADGRTINIDLSMTMSREFAEYTSSSVAISPVNSIDPLVVNYGGTAASLTGEKFAFDLDVDGKMDMISGLGEGSGFLALDKNGDGKINDGSELFGPQSGSGFDELRRYDSDGNGWIDEADEVFENLLVWSKDKNGNDQLFSLKELDIGAIYLGDIATEFSMNGTDNTNYGTMRSTSVFLREDLTAGTISHIDLTT